MRAPKAEDTGKYKANKMMARHSRISDRESRGSYKGGLVLGQSQ